jgi:hypothetical protein
MGVERLGRRAVTRRLFAPDTRIDLAATERLQPHATPPRRGLPVGGAMLWKIGLVLLFVWLLGVLGVYDVGQRVHVLLFAGLMLLTVAFSRARDAALRQEREAALRRAGERER